MNGDFARQTCLKLRFSGEESTNSVVFVKATWFALRFDLSIVDGVDAWMCDAAEAEVARRAAQLEMLPSEFMALTEMHLASQQLGSAYRFEDIGDGQRRLSWTFEKRGEIMEWRWDCELCGDKKRATIEFLDSLLDMHIPLARLSERANGSISPLAAKDPELKIRQRLKNERVKAVWDDKKHTAFVRICLEQMRAGNRPHKTLNKLGYMNLAREFHKHTGFFYHKDQLKNHWDSTRRDWQAWTALKNQPGLGWDCSKGTFSQTEDWWACFAKMFPGSEKFAHRPLEHQEELDLLFGEALASPPLMPPPGTPNQLKLQKATPKMK